MPEHQQFFVPGPLPNLTEILTAAKGYNGRGFAYADMKKNWTDLVADKIRRAFIEPVPSCRLIFYWKEAGRRRDPDNFCTGMKFCMDGLVKAGIIKGDGWDHVRGFEHYWEVDKSFPGVLVEIQAMPLEVPEKPARKKKASLKLEK